LTVKPFTVYLIIMLKLLVIAAILITAFFLGTAKSVTAQPLTANSFTLPDQAVEVSPGTYYLGKAIHEGKQVEGYAFIDYRGRSAKPSGAGKNAPSCYGFLARGAKWKEVESWQVNPTNTRGLEVTNILNTLSSAVTTWEGAAGQIVLGGGVTTDNQLVADTSSPDDRNEVYFADIDSAGAIGVTIVWGIFGGPPQTRELVEWDQIYDDFDYNWSADCTAENCTNTKMDFPSIAIHELGHAVGLDDLYETSCNQETMYGYADYGETHKRDLGTGDIAGVSSLY